MAGMHVRRWVVVVAAIMLVGCGDDGNGESLDAGGDVVVVDLGASDMDLGGDGSGPPERCTADQQVPVPAVACAVIAAGGGHGCARSGRAGRLHPRVSTRGGVAACLARPAFV